VRTAIEAAGDEVRSVGVMKIDAARGPLYDATDARSGFKIRFPASLSARLASVSPLTKPST